MSYSAFLQSILRGNIRLNKCIDCYVAKIGYEYAEPKMQKTIVGQTWCYIANLPFYQLQHKRTSHMILARREDDILNKSNLYDHEKEIFVKRSDVIENNNSMYQYVLVHKITKNSANVLNFQEINELCISIKGES